MKDIFYNTGLCKKNDDIRMNKMPLSPTNLYANYSVSVNGEYKYFYKKLLDISAESFFEYELMANIELSELNIAPEVIYFDREQKIIITKFVNNVKNGLKNKLGVIAKQLNYFHSKCNSFNNKIYTQKRKFWFDKYEKLPTKIQNDFKCVYEIIVNQKNIYDSSDEVVSHNDFHCANILVFEETVYIIDFDHIGRNSRYFDLATLSISLQLNEEMEHYLLKNYSSDYDYKKFVVQKAVCVANYALSTVALVEDIEEIDSNIGIESKAFSWKCNDISNMNKSRLQSAYNFLNYYKDIISKLTCYTNLKF